MSENQFTANATTGEQQGLTVESLLACTTTSYWLRNALRSALERDPVDAANDAQVLSAALSARSASLLSVAAKPYSRMPWSAQ